MFCWLQGLEQAPLVVRVCYESLVRNLQNKEIIVLTKENIKEYVTLPDFIEKKHQKGIISNTKYSDLLRLELLIKHGGTWIDATVLCTDSGFPQTIMDCDLFVFQQKRKDGELLKGLSNWFITSSTNNEVLMMVRDLLYEYWKRYNCDIDYFIFHLFFCMTAEVYPEKVEAMPRRSNRLPLLLGMRLADDYDDEWYHELCQRTCFHKLTYKLKNNAERQGSFYDVVVRSHGFHR